MRLVHGAMYSVMPDGSLKVNVAYDGNVMQPGLQERDGTMHPWTESAIILDPGERVCSCDRGEECDRLSAQVKRQAETILDYRRRMREAKALLEHDYEVNLKSFYDELMGLLTDPTDKPEEVKA